MALLHDFFQLMRFALNSDRKMEIGKSNEISSQLEVLQLDSSNPELVSDACIYLADPHKLPRPTKDGSENASKRESNVDDGSENASKEESHMNNGISHFHYETSNDQDQLSKQCQMSDMSDSSDSELEQAFLDHFRYGRRFKSDKEIEKNDGSCTDFTSSMKQRHMDDEFAMLLALNKRLKFHGSPLEGNFNLQNITETVSISNGKNPSDEDRKQQVNNNVLDKNDNPVQHFCTAPLIASTPLSKKPDSESQDRPEMMNSALQNKVRQSKRQILLNCSTDSTNSINTVSSRDGTPNREQGAIAKHIARIRASNSKFNTSKKTSLDNSSQYYSMRTSFGSNSSTSIS